MQGYATDAVQTIHLEDSRRDKQPSQMQFLWKTAKGVNSPHTFIQTRLFLD